MNAPTDHDREMIAGLLAGLSHIGFKPDRIAKLAADTRIYLSSDLSEQDRLILSYRDVFYQLGRGHGDATVLQLRSGEENAL